MLFIKKCSLPGAWYKDKVGEMVRHIPRKDWEEDGFYCAIEDEGYKNIVKIEDAVIVNMVVK